MVALGGPLYRAAGQPRHKVDGRQASLSRWWAPIMTSWTISDEPRVQPPTRGGLDSRVRTSVVAALKEMLLRAEQGRLHVADETQDDVAVVLEHANVRCVLVVQAPGVRTSLSPRESQIARLIAD
jgi:hypothetical protein